MVQQSIIRRTKDTKSTLSNQSNHCKTNVKLTDISSNLSHGSLHRQENVLL